MMVGLISMARIQRWKECQIEGIGRTIKAERTNERKVKWEYRRASKFGFSIIGDAYWKRYICIQNERKSVLECRNIVKGETGTSEVGSEISNCTGGI